MLYNLYQKMEVIHIIYVIVRALLAYALRSIDSDIRFEVWSNFEIADMDFWRGEAYTAFFDFLDSQGGFYYEVRPNHGHCT
jgi:hypothetical protein